MPFLYKNIINVNYYSIVSRSLRQQMADATKTLDVKRHTNNTGDTQNLSKGKPQKKRGWDPSVESLKQTTHCKWHEQMTTTTRRWTSFTTDKNNWCESVIILSAPTVALHLNCASNCLLTSYQVILQPNNVIQCQCRAQRACCKCFTISSSGTNTTYYKWRH